MQYFTNVSNTADIKFYLLVKMVHVVKNTDFRFRFLCWDRVCVVTTVCTAARLELHVTLQQECVGVRSTASPPAGTCCSDARHSWVALWPRSIRLILNVQTTALVWMVVRVVNCQMDTMDVVRMKRFVNHISFILSCYGVLPILQNKLLFFFSKIWRRSFYGLYDTHIVFHCTIISAGHCRMFM